MRDHSPQVCSVPSAPSRHTFARRRAWYGPERVTPALRHRRCCDPINHDEGEVR
jgi:hypothetical protein